MPKKILTAITLSTVTLLLVCATAAEAHPGFYHQSGGLLAGLEHPLGGADHILAMVAIGLWAAQIGGRAIWAMPLAFISAMVVGGVFGAFGMTLPFAEQGIVLSDILLGALILCAMPVSLTAAIGLTGFFALFHGAAHGAEMPHSTSIAWYAGGFAISTLMLHVCGLGAGILARRYLSGLVIRSAGAAVFVGGLLVAAQIL
jgi:urease accessory protein